MAKGQPELDAERGATSNTEKLSQCIPQQTRKSVRADVRQHRARPPMVGTYSERTTVPSRRSSLAIARIPKTGSAWLDGSRMSSPDRKTSRTNPIYASDVSTNSSSAIMVAFNADDDRISLLNQTPSQRPGSKPTITSTIRRKIVHPALGHPLGTQEKRPTAAPNRKTFHTAPKKPAVPRGSSTPTDSTLRSKSSYSSGVPKATTTIMPHPITTTQDVETQTSLQADERVPKFPRTGDFDAPVGTSPRMSFSSDGPLHNPDPEFERKQDSESTVEQRHFLPSDSADQERHDLLQAAVDAVDQAMRENRPQNAQNEPDRSSTMEDQSRRPSRANRLVISDSDSNSVHSGSSAFRNSSSDEGLPIHPPVGPEVDVEMQSLTLEHELSPTATTVRRRSTRPAAVDWADLHSGRRRSSASSKIKSYLIKDNLRTYSDLPSLEEPVAAELPKANGLDAQSRSRRSSNSDRPLLNSAVDTGLSEVSLRHPRRKHLSFRNDSGFSFYRQSRRQPLARNWSNTKKRVTAIVACINTALLGMIIGIYAGEVPRIQYQLADEQHVTILGNMYFYFGLAITTFLFWPLPLLHGRKIYILVALAVTMPLQFPQGIITSAPRSPKTEYRVGVMLPRALSGLAMGLANINLITTLLDLFGASLQSKSPHQEIAFFNDVRHHGGGLGIWLGIWSFCFIASIAIGFLVGAGIVNRDLNPAWGFYVTVIMLAMVLVLNLLTPETRRSQWRRSFAEYVDEKDQLHRRVARGEIKLHISTEGPAWWFEEVGAGLTLSIRMATQPGFIVMALYLAWMYAQIILVIVLLGALLSREYRWRPYKVGLGVASVAVGALLAVPLSKAGKFSRSRKQAPRTDSMTIAAKVSWTSHMVRRIIFTITLPLMGLAYTLGSPGRHVHWTVPVVFTGAIGFFSNLAIAECYGLIMETFDTCDLQPGVNSRHRLQSLASDVARRRTNYSCFPRVTAGIFVSQSLGFLLAAAATAVGGVMTRRLGAQTSTGVTAGILFLLTIMLILVLWRFKEVQVVPNSVFHTWRQSFSQGFHDNDDWKPVVLGNPSGKMRRISILEMGSLSRWTEIRKLNKLA